MHFALPSSGPDHCIAQLTTASREWLVFSYCKVSWNGTQTHTKVSSLCTTLSWDRDSVGSATLAQSRVRLYSADQLWPASLCVTYCVAEWQVPCGISTELTAGAGNLEQSTLLPREGLCVTFWPQFKDTTNDTAPELAPAKYCTSHIVTAAPSRNPI